ncbi:MAG: hypothetical protein PHQ36_13075 [Anaerolineales bacterium]|nr:hypothetical protein [Anaerolineales bacterium]
MNTTLNKVSSILAFIVGALSIIAGGMAMRGWNPGYFVLNWLPVYNFVMGIFTLLPAALIWKNSRYAMPAAVATFGVHAVVLFASFCVLE